MMETFWTEGEKRNDGTASPPSPSLPPRADSSPACPDEHQVKLVTRVLAPHLPPPPLCFTCPEAPPPPTHPPSVPLKARDAAFGTAHLFPLCSEANAKTSKLLSPPALRYNRSALEVGARPRDPALFFKEDGGKSQADGRG